MRIVQAECCPAPFARFELHQHFRQPRVAGRSGARLTCGARSKILSPSCCATHPSTPNTLALAVVRLKFCRVRPIQLAVTLGEERAHDLFGIVRVQPAAECVGRRAPRPPAGYCTITGMPTYPRRLWLCAFAASLAVLLIGIWFQVSLAQHWTRPAALPYGVNNPVLALQMAKPPWPAEMLAPAGNMAEMTRQQYIDFGYIPSYAALFICIALLESQSHRRWIAALGLLSIVLILVAAGFDVAENFAILGVTVDHKLAAWAAIRPHSLVKWTCVFLTVLLESPFYFDVRVLTGFARVLAGVLGAAGILAGLLGLYSSIAGYERGIGMAMLPLLVAMLAMPPFLWLGGRGPWRQ